MLLLMDLMAVLPFDSLGVRGFTPLFASNRVSAQFCGAYAFSRLVIVSRCPFPYDAVSIGSFNAEAIRGQLSNV